jgi:hypothetical protein
LVSAGLFQQVGVPGLAPQGDTTVSNPSVTAVATRTTAAFDTDPIARFQQRVAAELALSDLQRQLDRCERQLAPVRPARAVGSRRSRRSAWWPSLAS